VESQEDRATTLGRGVQRSDAEKREQVVEVRHVGRELIERAFDQLASVPVIGEAPSDRDALGP
jgi:hypothetical protein